MQEKTESIDPRKIVFNVTLVLVGLAATSFFTSVGLELTNEADDVSVGAGFVLLGGISLAWLYAGLRVYSKFFGVNGEK